MNDPKRLLEAEHGRARELLEVGLSDVAPARTRANVLSSVSNIVANLELGAPNVGSLGTPQGAGALGKLVVITRAATALKLSAVAATLGFGGLVYHYTRDRDTVPDAQPIVAASAASVPANVAAPTIVQAKTAPDVLAPPAPEARSRVLPSLRAGSSSARAPEPEQATPAPVSGEIQHEGDLGAELDLIARARARLAAREPQLALLLLHEFTQRFPHGTLTPEARLLEQRARAQLDPAAP